MPSKISLSVGRFLVVVVNHIAYLAAMATLKEGE